MGYEGALGVFFGMIFPAIEAAFLYLRTYRELSMFSMTKHYLTVDIIISVLDTGFNIFFNILKLAVILLAIIYLTMIIGWIIKKEKGIFILPFETSVQGYNGKAISDLLNVELQKIKDLRGRETVGEKSELGKYDYPSISLKSEALEYNLADMGSLGLGDSSLSIGNILIGLKQLCPGNRKAKTIGGSIHTYGSIISIVAYSGEESWEVRHTLKEGEALEKCIPTMIKDLSFKIALGLGKPRDLAKQKKNKPQYGPQRSKYKYAQTWAGFKYLVEALDAYHNYVITGNEKDLGQARMNSLEAKQAEPDYEEPWVLISILGFDYLKIEKYDIAEMLFHEIEEQQTDSIALGLGLIYARQANHDEALVFFEKAIELNPKNEEAWNNKGVVLAERGLYKDALKYFHKTTKLNPKFTRSLNNKGAAFKRLGFYKLSIKFFKRATDIDEKYEMAWSNMGDAFLKLNNYEEAINCFDKVLKINSQDAESMCDKGVALNKLSRFEDANKCFEKAIKCCDKILDKNSSNAKAYYDKGIALYHLGKYKNAIEAHVKANNFRRSFANAWLGEGDALSALGYLNVAIKAYENTIKINPNDYQAWYGKGNAFYGLGNYNDAIKAYDNAININRNYSEAKHGKVNAEAKARELKIEADHASKQYV
jgi:tetratricopeptide (TPR) repeat protein